MSDGTKFRVGHVYQCRDGAIMRIEAIRDVSRYMYPIQATVIRGGTHTTPSSDEGSSRIYRLDGQWLSHPGPGDLMPHMGIVQTDDVGGDDPAPTVVSPVSMDAVVYKGVTLTKAELEWLLAKFS